MRNSIVIILIAYVAFVVLGLPTGLNGVAWPSLRGTFDQPVDALGILLVSWMVGYVAAGYLNGRFISRFGMANLLVYSITIAAAGTLLQSFAPLWLVVILGSTVAGFGSGMLDAGLNTYAAANFRPRLMNWLHASFGAGSTLGSLLMTGILSLGYGWRIGLQSLAAFQVVVLVLFVATRGQWSLGASINEEAQAETTAVKDRDTLRLWSVWLGIIIFFFYVGMEVGVGTWAFTVLSESRGLPEATAGFGASLFWGSFFVGRILLGFIETNLPRLIRLGAIFTFVGIVLFAISDLPALALFGLAIAGAANAPIFPAMIALTPGRVGDAHAPNAIGFQIAASGIGGASLPWLAGVLGDAFSLELIMWFFAICTLLMFIAHEFLAVRDRGVAPAPVSAD